MARTAYDPLKRALDLVVGGLFLVISLPLQAAIAYLVRKRLGSPVLFKQERPGKKEKIFTLVKFRTMLDPDPEAGLLSDEQRLTAFGAKLRSMSLDELPTLWNVVRGDMSLVGPRPLLVRYLVLYNPEQRRRHEVRPGVTGLAQISGRNSIGWAAKFEKDIEYVNRRNLALDVAILLSTVRSVLRREGISDASGPTMTEFHGARSDTRD